MGTNMKLADRRTADTTTFRAINRSIQALTNELQKDETGMPETTSARIARLVRIYEGVEPLLDVVSATRLIPENWRLALALFNEALAAVIGGSDEPGTADFKAGKDLEA
jgi:hypothetical protein